MSQYIPFPLLITLGVCLYVCVCVCFLFFKIYFWVFFNTHHCRYSLSPWPSVMKVALQK
ncbi:Uncharacterized protein APZ42_030934 [Daphnia magna]|uniref:Uncharacterized protein n=1 Tax=Daphnia magna TaxID=35525 RepID=A0A164NGD0_9CRUS|nr:Uncharacterized protein APZ42_030934 [Daphnia magna]